MVLEVRVWDVPHRAKIKVLAELGSLGDCIFQLPGPPTSLGPWPPSCNARLNSSMLSRLWVSPFWLLLPLTRTLLIAPGSSDSPGKVNARDHVNKYCGAYMCHFNLVKLFSVHEMFSKHLHLVWVHLTVLWRKVYRLYTITEMES